MIVLGVEMKRVQPDYHGDLSSNGRVQMALTLSKRHETCLRSRNLISRSREVKSVLYRRVRRWIHPSRAVFAQSSVTDVRPKRQIGG